MIRLFVALDLPGSVRDRLASLCNGIPEVRWIDPQNMHLTLRFVGEVDEPILPEIDAALSAIRYPGFRLALSGVDIFGDRRRARNLWAGVLPSEDLTALQSKVESTLSRVGLVAESRKFHPHITLSRLKGMKVDRLVGYLEANAAFMTEEFSIGAFVLYSSRLSRNGATYTPKATYPLDSA
jgi:2'-5' RNA ligase